MEKNKELYVLNKGNRYVVSRKNLVGYVKYTKTGNECWIPEGEETSEGVKTSEVDKKIGKGENGNKSKTKTKN